MKTFTLILVLLLPLPLQAGWVDDWLQQQAGTSPGSFSGQQRGYYTGGGFSGRWQSTADYPVTVEVPRIKSGCGGIDVFMGGFSFMNTDYLVNKLQAILTNAPAVAFDLALKTLCEQCSNTVKNFEALADFLNSMQIDECAAAREMVGVVMDDSGFHSKEVMRERLGTAIKENKLVSGTADLWHTLTSEDRTNNNQPQAGDVAAVTSGCHADVTAVFLSGGSLLANVGARMGIPATHTDLMRGLIGDLRLEGPATAYRISMMAPCPQNNVEDLGAFTEGEVYVQNIAGTCSLITSTNRDLVDYVSTILNGIADRITAKGALTVTEQEFLDNTPLSALPILKTAVGSGAREAVVPALAEIIARAYSLRMLSDLTTRAEHIALKAQEMLERQAGPTGGQPPERCAAIVFAGQADQHLGTMLKRIQRVRESARGNYVAAANEMNGILAYLAHMQRMEAQMTAELTRRFGKDIAARVGM